ncbi:glycosyltransferase family A protein [Flavivirga aquimarina]|uniref:Glycosyltransferase family A protein n=1 Tax=Flavivirga aquimarina TaxID=2027862 RepID=A0ABT8WCQ8_9FLAO|nr:glycosyltransferase family A protein [Flavivirga aquimarina]MDO5970923.1 glycosyltransferase family A protein [Flavivirga aquimarina]
MEALTKENDLKLEVLISTMNKVSLAFVKEMFPYNNMLKDVNVLIVNQTEKGKELTSDFDNIRVINSYEIGLSKSRNLAVKNAVGDICLIADDDVVYKEGFQEIIKKTFATLPKVSIIKFKIETFCGKEYKSYPNTSKIIHKEKDMKEISSIEMAFKRKDILKNNIYFNTFFGLGSNFLSGEEYLFLSDAINKNLIIYFKNKFIVKHSFQRSTSNLGSDNFIKAQTALYFHKYKNLGYLLLFKLVFFLLRKDYIKFKHVGRKIMVGLNAIKEYKKLNEAC